MSTSTTPKSPHPLCKLLPSHPPGPWTISHCRVVEMGAHQAIYPTIVISKAMLNMWCVHRYNKMKKFFSKPVTSQWSLSCMCIHTDVKITRGANNGFLLYHQGETGILPRDIWKILRKLFCIFKGGSCSQVLDGIYVIFVLLALICNFPSMNKKMQIGTSISSQCWVD